MIGYVTPEIQVSKYYITSYTCTSLIKSFHHIFKEIREIAHV